MGPYFLDTEVINEHDFFSLVYVPEIHKNVWWENSEMCVYSKK